MEKTITILDKEYKTWISELSSRYRKSQIKLEEYSITQQFVEQFEKVEGTIPTIEEIEKSLAEKTENWERSERRIVITGE